MTRFKTLGRLGTLCGVLAIVMFATGCPFNNPCNGVDCNDDDPCTTDSCSGGECSHDAVANCCEAASDCADTDACTIDACANIDTTTGAGTCTHTAVGQNCCNDSTDCGAGEVCTNNQCGPACTGPADCDDGDPCTTDACTSLGCTNTDITCNTGEICVDGNCVLSCTADADCDDGDACTTDACVNGGCASTALDCNDNVACTDDACDAGTCTHTDNCTSGACDLTTGTCSACVADVDCDDSNDCTDDVCNNGTCENNNNTAACSDGDACTTGDVCADGTCAGTAVTCPPGQQCNASTGNCQAIVCTSNSQCDDGFSCTTDTCNLGTGACVYTNIDAACDDNLFCTGVGEVCDPTNPDAEAGTGCVRPGNPCVNPTPICQESNDSCIACTSNAQCDDGYSCTSDTCAAGSCNNTPVNTQCPDPLKCDGDDICDPNHAGADKTTGCYAPGNPCAPKVCHENTYVVGDPNTCSNCTSNADCSDGVTCTQDSCDGFTGNCNPPINDSTLCPDTLFCDGDDVCNPADPDANATTGCISGLTSNPPGGYPCATACNEATNQCFNCTSNLDCSDNIACTDDLCNGVTFQCSHVDNCQGGLICNVHTGQCE